MRRRTRRSSEQIPAQRRRRTAQFDKRQHQGCDVEEFGEDVKGGDTLLNNIVEHTAPRPCATTSKIPHDSQFACRPAHDNDVVEKAVKRQPRSAQAEDPARTMRERRGHQSESPNSKQETHIEEEGLEL